MLTHGHFFQLDFVKKTSQRKRLHIPRLFALPLRRLGYLLARSCRLQVRSCLPLCAILRLDSQHIVWFWAFRKSFVHTPIITGPTKTALLWESGDADFCVRLAVAALHKMATLLAVAYDGYLVSAARFNELGGDFGAVQVWSADFGLGAIIGKQDFIESDLHPLFGNAVELFDAQNAVLSNDILLPARFDDSYLGHVCATIPKIGKKDKGFDTISQQVDDASMAMRGGTHANKAAKQEASLGGSRFERYGRILRSFPTRALFLRGRIPGVFTRAVPGNGSRRG